MQYETRFGSMADYDKGGVEIIDDDPKNYGYCASPARAWDHTISFG